MTPEQKAREQIDTLLGRCGWTVQTKHKINLSASRGVAVCELSFVQASARNTMAHHYQSLASALCHLARAFEGDLKWQMIL